MPGWGVPEFYSNHSVGDVRSAFWPQLQHQEATNIHEKTSFKSWQHPFLYKTPQWRTNTGHLHDDLWTSKEKGNLTKWSEDTPLLQKDAFIQDTWRESFLFCCLRWHFWKLVFCAHLLVTRKWQGCLSVTVTSQCLVLFLQFLQCHATPTFFWGKGLLVLFPVFSSVNYLWNTFLFWLGIYCRKELCAPSKIMQTHDVQPYTTNDPKPDLKPKRTAYYFLHINSIWATTGSVFKPHHWDNETNQQHARFVTN